MIRIFYRKGGVELSSAVLEPEPKSFAIRTRRRAWLKDVVVLSALEAREIAAAIQRATFYDQAVAR